MRATLDRVRRNGDDGFTLIELLIVIIILGVLAAVVVFSVNGITNKGDKAACQTEVSTIDTAYEAAVAQGSSATNIEDLYTLKLDGTTAGLKLIHGKAPTTNLIDGNSFAGSVPISTVDSYTCS